MRQDYLSQPKYRPDIDGLRAFAILSLLAFHFSPTTFPGGFIGVDIFFVISGYLISTIIFSGLDKNTFIFREFYARRIKRIFPCLILVLVASFAFGWFALLAEEYRQLGKHIAGGAAFVSNLILWNESGYFDNDAVTKPLLNLWSLAIEEQFYISWPFILWFAHKRKLNLLTVCIIIAALSFFLNIRTIDLNVVAGFYSPYTRFWELMSGSILSWYVLYKPNYLLADHPRLETLVSKLTFGSVKNCGHLLLVNTVSILGILLLLYGFYRIDKGIGFPGKWALIPVFGTMLLIYAGPTTWVNRVIFSNRAAIFFGLISYPLYLWHWPMLSFARIVEGDAPSFKIRAILVALSVALAWLTYKLIETPIRKKGCGNLKVTILVLLMMIIGFVGYNTYSREGLSFRQNATLKGYVGDIGHLYYHKYIAEKYYVCKPEAIAKEALEWEGFIRCIQSKPSSSVDIALVGDSHAEHLFLGMAQALPAKNVVFYIKNSPPFIGNPEFEKIFKTIIESKSINMVILTMDWYGRYDQVPLGSTLDRELIEIIDLLSNAGKYIYLVDGVAISNFAPDRCKGRRWMSTKDPSCEMNFENFKKQRARYSDSLNKVIKERSNVKVLEIGKYLCNEKKCTMTMDNEILYRDNHHLNLNGSSYIGRKLVEDNVLIFN